MNALYTNTYMFLLFSVFFLFLSSLLFLISVFQRDSFDVFSGDWPMEMEMLSFCQNCKQSAFAFAAYRSLIVCVIASRAYTSVVGVHGSKAWLLHVKDIKQIANA